MSDLHSRWAIAALLFAGLTLIASFMAAFYWLQYNDLLQRSGGAVIQVSLGVNYGNGTTRWKNETKALLGATLFDVTKQNFNVTYTVGVYGTEVLSIDSVAKNDNFGWTYWLMNSTDYNPSWSIIWSSADKYRISNEQTLLWFYQNGFAPP